MKKKSQIFLKSNFFKEDTKKSIENIKKKYLDNNNYHLIIRNFEKDKKKLIQKLLNFQN